MRRLTALVHSGEAEAIALAMELDVPLIIDEKTGRRVARSLGVVVTGTLAVILSAKNAGLIDHVDPVLQQLAVAGFHLGRALRDRARRSAGEG